MSADVLMSATCIPNLRRTLTPSLPRSYTITAVEVTVGAYHVPDGVEAIGSGRRAVNSAWQPAQSQDVGSGNIWCPPYWLERKATKFAVCIINLPQQVLNIEPAALANATDLMPALGSPAATYGWGAHQYSSALQRYVPKQLKGAAALISNCSTPLVTANPHTDPAQKWIHSQQPCFLCTDIPAIVNVNNAGALCYGDEGAPLIVRDARSGVLKVFGVFVDTTYGPNGHSCGANPFLPQGVKEKNLFVNVVAGEVAEWVALTLQE